ncbi:MAG: hypothetical protein F4Z77_04340 [Dehalococcoidia bacterium]|nr:hypothetical protein [Dehalococcoidia bacterium]MYA53590.1 hypothetical protein [Dehalococcoidia bacterium]
MKPISATLRDHQRRPDRLPHVRVTVRAERWGVPLLPWERLYAGDEGDCPHALAVTGDGAVVRARNDGGAIHVSRVANPGAASSWGVWSKLGDVEADTGVALAARGSEVLLLSVASGGRSLELHRSADGGTTWSAAVALVRESADIGGVALAIRASDGDACAFYISGTTVLKRLRRRAGSWDATGIAWNRGGEVSALTGVGATHDGSDYRLIVSGRAHPAGSKHVWAAFLGDTRFPLDSWSGLNVIAESDASSAREFTGPSVFRPGLVDQRAVFSATDAGSETPARVYTSHPPAFVLGNPEGWSEPEPHEATSAFGLAVATPDAATAWASTPDGVWRARLAPRLDLSEALVEASWRLAPFATRARVVLDDAGGALTGLAPGSTVAISPGYRSAPGEAPEYGLTVNVVIDRVTRESAAGRARVVLECSGHWERLASWRASQVWQTAPGDLSRESLFWLLCARVGVRAGGQGGEDWSRSAPAFVIPPGESALSAARRLLGSSRVAVVPDGQGLAVSVPGDDIAERYGPGAHPVDAVGLGDAAPPTNWVRARGPAHDADAHDFASIYRDGQRLQLVRTLDAGTGAGAQAVAHAAAYLDRDRRERGDGFLVAPFHAGLQLYDAIAVTDERLGLRERPFRIVELGMEYSRRPARAPRYDSVLALGEMD